VDQAGFARQIPQTEIPELLLNLFLSPPSGSKIWDILRHHHRLPAGIRGLREFIAERIQIGYFEYRIHGPGRSSVQRITPRELVAENTAGFTTTQPSRGSRAVLLPMPAHVETLVHEGCHFYAHRNFSALANSRQNIDRIVFGLRLSQILVEGFAEYFARQVMRANQARFGPITIEAYSPEVEVVNRLVVTMEEQSARDAYFRGNSAAINRLVRAIELNAETHPDLLVPPFMIQ
jgi:hypothetical protein